MIRAHLLAACHARVERKKGNGGEPMKRRCNYVEQACHDPFKGWPLRAKVAHRLHCWMSELVSWLEAWRRRQLNPSWLCKEAMVFCLWLYSPAGSPLRRINRFLGSFWHHYYEKNYYEVRD
jgi:hypothetical protein